MAQFSHSVGAVRVLLTDGNERASLAAARSLIAAGYDVYVTAGKRLSLAAVSRRVHAIRLQTDPFEQPRAYAVELGALVREIGVRVLLPVSDASIEAVLENRSAIPESVSLPFPDLETYRRGSDKAQGLALARDVGLDVPETIILEPGDVSHLPDAAFFPAVLKPHRSVIPPGADGRPKRALAVTYVPNLRDCRAALAALPAEAFPLLLQRRVRGSGEGLFLLRWDGKIVAAFAHQRLREKPPAGGVSVYRRSIPLDPALLAAGAAFLDRLNWTGVAMIEGKRDHQTGRFVYMELNGRLWGSLQLAIDAGVDFPALLVDCALGRSVTPVRHYAADVRSRWFWGDIDQLYLRLTRRAADLHLENGNGSRLKAMWEFLRIRPGRDREEIWRWRDPAPFLVETLRWARLLK